MENLFDALCYALLLPENQTRFRKAEAHDLMLRYHSLTHTNTQREAREVSERCLCMSGGVCGCGCRCLREKKQSAIGALRALDSALMNNPANVEKLVELGGLKTVFPVFMVPTHTTTVLSAMHA